MRNPPMRRRNEHPRLGASVGSHAGLQLWAVGDGGELAPGEGGEGAQAVATAFDPLSYGRPR